MSSGRANSPVYTGNVLTLPFPLIGGGMATRQIGRFTMATRSPGYPAINLEDAIAKARVLYSHEKKNTTSVEVLSQHWNYRVTSSGAKLAIAALKKFGLLE